MIYDETITKKYTDEYLFKLRRSYDKRDMMSNIFDIIVWYEYRYTDSLYEALLLFNDFLKKKGYRIRKIKEMDMEGYPDPDGNKILIITKLGYTETICEKMYFWWHVYTTYPS